MQENAYSKKLASVVVGVDGSAGALEALRWALAEARLRHAPLRIVHAWTYAFTGSTVGGNDYLGGFGSYAAAGLDASDLQVAAEALVDRMVHEIVDDMTGVDVERHVVHGGAAATLLSAAAPGDLLVVGSRGHGGFVDLLIGSVSQQCVHHAQCPVVVVHPPKTTRSDYESVDQGTAVVDDTLVATVHRQ